MSDLSDLSDLSAVSTLSIAEAADLSQVSTRTVRRWMARGHVVTVVQGRERRVSALSLSEYLDTLGQVGQAPLDTGDTHADMRDTGDSADSCAAEAVHLAALVRELVAENHQLAATAAMWQERAGSLSDRLSLSESMLAQLQAPALPVDAPGPTPWPSLPQARSWAVYGAFLLVVMAGLGLALMLAPGVWRG